MSKGKNSQVIQNWLLQFSCNRFAFQVLKGQCWFSDGYRWVVRCRAIWWRRIPIWFWNWCSWGHVPWLGKGMASCYLVIIDWIGLKHIYFQVGIWTGEDGYTETRTVIPPAESEGSDSMKGKHFIVITALVRIFVAWNKYLNKFESKCDENNVRKN